MIRLGHDEKCPCEEHDCEWYINSAHYDHSRVVPVITTTWSAYLAPSVRLGRPNEKYMGSSGYREIPGNKCEVGSRMDERVSKDCFEGRCFKSYGGSVSHASFAAEPVKGAIVHQIVHSVLAFLPSMETYDFIAFIPW